MHEWSISFNKMDERALSPTKGKEGEYSLEEAGWDFYALDDVFLPATKLNTKELIKKINKEIVHGRRKSKDLDWISFMMWLDELKVENAPVTKVRTGIQFKLPSGSVGILYDRSGLSINNSITRVAGVIDSTYTGELVCGLVNLGNEDYQIKAGQKVIQMVLFETPLHVRWQNLDGKPLPLTNRNEKGFGSSD